MIYKKCRYISNQCRLNWVNCFLLLLLENYFELTAGRWPVHHFGNFIERFFHLLWSKQNMDSGVDDPEEHSHTKLNRDLVRPHSFASYSWNSVLSFTTRLVIRRIFHLLCWSFLLSLQNSIQQSLISNASCASKNNSLQPKIALGFMQSGCCCYIYRVHDAEKRS